MIRGVTDKIHQLPIFFADTSVNRKDIYIYYINTNEVPDELSRKNVISSHVKHVIFTCENITVAMAHCCYGSLLLWLVLKIFQHSKKNFISPRGHVISSLSIYNIYKFLPREHNIIYIFLPSAALKLMRALLL